MNDAFRLWLVSTLLTLSQVISILAQNPKLPLHVACNYMSNTLKVANFALYMLE